eukprot:594238-Pyramimonas_sp.AAC.1
MAPNSGPTRFWAGWAIRPLSAISGRLGVDAYPPEPTDNSPHSESIQAWRLVAARPTILEAIR